jgi:DNA modification methylase
MLMGDSCQVIKGLPDRSIDFTIFSPPFSNLYIYSDSEADMGNCSNDEEFFAHYAHLVPELYRVTVPGRCVAVHCKDLPLYRGSDGSAGLKDFPGMLIRSMEAGGFTFHSRVTIWKCPVTERERTNNNGLLHKTVMRDSSQIRQGMADYLIVFRRTPDTTGDNLSDKPVTRLNGFERYVGDPDLDPRVVDVHPSKYARKGRAGNTSVEVWRRYAEPVWWDINQTDVLNQKIARAGNDEKHICPLQLGLIRRAIELWTLPGDVVFSPFAGIGSEGYVALQEDRKFVGIELKREYYDWAIHNLTAASSSIQGSLFETAPGVSDNEEESCQVNTMTSAPDVVTSATSMPQDACDVPAPPEENAATNSSSHLNPTGKKRGRPTKAQAPPDQKTDGDRIHEPQQDVA